jgi:hypothetical protein
MSDAEMRAVVDGVLDVVRPRLHAIVARLDALEQGIAPTSPAKAVAHPVEAGTRPRYRGAHEAGACYTPGDTVTDLGIVYIARSGGYLGPPAANAYWRCAANAEVP